MNSYTNKDWHTVKSAAAIRWQHYAANPLLPPEYKAEKVAYWLAVEEGADNALQLLQIGHSLEETAQMVVDFLEWKLGGAA